MSEAGLITIASNHSAVDTLERLRAAIESAGMTIFALFDHAAAASEVHLALRPTTVLAFGNPTAGTKLMQVNQLAGIDLPLKILLWEDELGVTKLTYNDPGWLAERHALGEQAAPQIAGMTKLLASITQTAAD